ncbi:SRPBCC family protein [Cryptosporangium arvum]|uniref:Polyketide cyclase / dehydrase and lipid transport n=1 Tax=Cryptosporangium arvum DSM 44712 TaxID=927661 RepID=A0A011AKX5_9ACTN|nr:SRPBCC family protein [Cryptosporangium arvum]EXG82616.1 hypothetical protein CryarDRAFT_3813 [Cryptosporangium arvum DSM 44712]
MNDMPTVDETAPVISRHELTTPASAEDVWRVLTDIDSWTTWLPDISHAGLETPGPLAEGSVFRWVAPGRDVVSTVVLARPFERLVWTGQVNGPGGISGVSAWTFTPGGDGLLVSAAESLAGPPAEAAAEQIQPALDEGLARWMRFLLNAAEAK